MLKDNRICKLLNIRYPILQGGMLWLATAELAAAVSNAGGLGIISPCAGMERHGDQARNLSRQIAMTRKLTGNPFAVNIPLDLELSGILINTIMEEKVGIVVTAAGDPASFTDLLRSEGIKILHVASSVRQARHAESCGVDAVIVEGVEAAAHLGFDEIPLFSLLPQVADAVSLPLVATGGIADGRGMAAAFTLGADGVQMGTRFVAVKENIAHENYKQAIVEAGDADTVITCRKLLPARSIKTGYAKKLLDFEATGASAEEIRTFMGYSRARKGQIEGDLENGEAYCSASAGLIKDILPAATVVENMMRDFERVIRKLPARAAEV